MQHAEPLAQRARTKIVATVGPASHGSEMLAALAAAGVDLFRLNMAHGTLAEHGQVLQTVRQLETASRPLAVLVDLAGPKIRLGDLPGGMLTCHENALVRFVRGDRTERPNELVSTYDKLIDDLEVGNQVLLADGTVALSVVDKQPDAAVCRVVQPGTVRTRQGINLPGAHLSLPSLTPQDEQCARWAAAQDVDYVGLSFVRTAAEIRQLTALLRESGSQAMVVAKIEKPEAVEHLETIVEAAGAVMVARGDLGVELDVAEVPVMQKRIISVSNRWQKPVIVATQMLESMHHAARPTRAEVSDVANAILDGADACMLSGETAIGDHPLLAVQTMNRVMLATEKLLSDGGYQPSVLSSSGNRPISRSVVIGAASIARQVEAKLVVVVTRTGATALTRSSQRDSTPTLALSPDPAVLRKMCLYWGITPLPGAPLADRLALREFVFHWGKSDGLLAPGDRIVTVVGTGVEAGAHNLLVVDVVEE